MGVSEAENRAEEAARKVAAGLSRLQEKGNRTEEGASNEELQAGNAEDDEQKMMEDG